MVKYHEILVGFLFKYSQVVSDTYTIIVGVVIIGIPFSLQLILSQSEKYNNEILIYRFSSKSVSPKQLITISFSYVALSIFYKLIYFDNNLIAFNNSILAKLFSFFLIFLFLFLVFICFLFYKNIYELISEDKYNLTRRLLLESSFEDREKINAGLYLCVENIMMSYPESKFYDLILEFHKKNHQTSM